jgi:hypothetical protein
MKELKETIDHRFKDEDGNIVPAEAVGASTTVNTRLWCIEGEKEAWINGKAPEGATHYALGKKLRTQPDGEVPQLIQYLRPIQ